MDLFPLSEKAGGLEVADGVVAACRALRSLPEARRCRIIVYSACSDPRVIAAALAAGADYFLSKPEDRDLIVETINGLL